MILYGQIIFDIRTKLKLTQTAMADKIGVHQSTIQALEAGRNAMPTLDIVIALVKHFNVNPYIFIHEGASPMFIERQTTGTEAKLLKRKIEQYEIKIQELYDLVNGKEKTLKAPSQKPKRAKI